MSEENSKIKKYFSKTIKELRLQFDYKQTYVAEYLGVKFQSYQDYEYGKTMPKYEYLIKLADLYDVSVDYLLGRGEI